MILDGTEKHYHIRELDNRFRINISTHQSDDFLFNTYISVEQLKENKWEYIPGTVVGLGNKNPEPIAERMYKEAIEKYK